MNKDELIKLTLTSAFHEVLPNWQYDEIVKHPLMNFALAYVAMAREAKYRPAAPGNGMGDIALTAEQLANPARLYREAVQYALHFDREEDQHNFYIGCSNYSTNMSLLWTIEAARQLASGSDGNATAIKLLQMAIKQIKASK